VAMKFIVHGLLLFLVISAIILRCILFLLEKVLEKKWVELSHTLQWKGVQVLNNIISYSGEFIMLQWHVKSWRVRKIEIVVCNKFLWKCEKVELAITTCQLHVYEWLCQFWYWYAK
jgi:hypothetical protein